MIEPKSTDIRIPITREMMSDLEAGREVGFTIDGVCVRIQPSFTPRQEDPKAHNGS